MFIGQGWGLHATRSRKISMTIVPIEGGLYSVTERKWGQAQFLDGLAGVGVDVDAGKADLVGIQGDAVAEEETCGRNTHRYPWQ